MSSWGEEESREAAGLARLAARNARRPGAGQQGVSELLRSYLGSDGFAGRMSETQRVVSTWNAVNGEVERRATCGVYVAPASRPGDDPVLVVYVDTRPRATDFMANREVYLARLANAGLRFSELRFRPTKRPPRKGPRDQAPAAPAPAHAAPRCGEGRPALSAEDAARERDLLATLSDHLDPRLRESVRRALDASFRYSRGKQQNS